MAKIKFALKMADGAEVRTLDQLREHFDLASVLGYYSSGRLYDWLESRGYSEAEKLKALNPSSDSFQRDLCEVLGVAYSEPENSDLSLSEIAARNGRLERLKRYTVDDAILAAVDRVAFTQEEMETLLAEDKCTSGISESCGISSSSISGLTTQTAFMTSTPTKRVIYLCGDRFAVPGYIGGITYIGINNPLIWFDGDIVASGIDVDGVDFDFDSYVDDGDIIKQFNSTFSHNPELGAKLLQNPAEKGSISAQIILGDCYSKGFGVQPSAEETVKWYQKAAEQGNAEAQASLGTKYWLGEGVGQSYKYAYKWFLRSAKQGYAIAQYNLGICYGHGKGVEKDEEEAIKWLQKAADQGFERARLEIIGLAPKLFPPTEVILYALGGKANCKSLTFWYSDDMTGSYGLTILVEDRSKVNEAVLRRLGGSVGIEPTFRTEISDGIVENIKVAAKDYFKKMIKPNDPPDIFPTKKVDDGGGKVNIDIKTAAGMQKEFENLLS